MSHQSAPRPSIQLSAHDISEEEEEEVFDYVGISLAAAPIGLPPRKACANTMMETIMEPVEFGCLRHDEDGRMWHEGKLFTGVAVEYWPNGQLASELLYADGIEDGLVAELASEWSPEHGDSFYRRVCDGTNEKVAPKWSIATGEGN
jgi:hypothetical protein